MTPEEFQKKLIDRAEIGLVFLFALALNSCDIDKLDGVESRLDKIAIALAPAPEAGND